VGCSSFEGILEVAQAITAPLDVEDVGAVEQPIEDGGGEDLVTDEQPGPVADALVGRDHHRAAAVAVADEAEEQAGFLAVQRIVQSRHRDQFVLKGGMLVTVWTGDDHRTTRDADFLGFGELDEERLREIFADIMTVDGKDGLMFDVEQLTAATIREDNIYGGVRLKTVAMLYGARIPITIDVGLGDALTQPEHVIDYPSLLGTPIPN
jgi:hypothetical protein